MRAKYSNHYSYFMLSCCMPFVLRFQKQPENHFQNSTRHALFLRRLPSPIKYLSMHLKLHLIGCSSDIFFSFLKNQLLLSAYLVELSIYQALKATMAFHFFLQASEILPLT